MFYYLFSFQTPSWCIFLNRAKLLALIEDEGGAVKMVKIFDLAAAPSSTAAVLAGGVIDNSALLPTISPTQSPNYPLFSSGGYYSDRDNYIRGLVSDLEEAVRVTRSLPDRDDLFGDLKSESQADNDAEEAEDAVILRSTQQAWMVGQGRATPPPQVMYCCSCTCTCTYILLLFLLCLFFSFLRAMGLVKERLLISLPLALALV